MNKTKIFSDLADLAGGAATMFSTLREQMRHDMKDRLDEWTERLDLVTRADIARLEGMVEKLRARLDKLEKFGAPTARPTASRSDPPKKPAPSSKVKKSAPASQKSASTFKRTPKK